MGTLHYGAPAATFSIDDRTLAHLELVIFAKLRRQENLSFSHTDESSGRRQAVWISPTSVVRFEYDGPMPEISKPWLQALVDTANSPGGLKIVAEPEAPPAR